MPQDLESKQEEIVLGTDVVDAIDEGMGVDFPDASPESVPEKAPRISMMENIMTVVKMMLGAEGTILPEFPYRFHTIQDDAGEILLLMEGNSGICKYIKERFVLNSILRFCKRDMPLTFRHQFWKLGHKDAREVVHQWIAQADPIEEPAMVLQKSRPGRTFHRLPFDLDSSHATPLFDEFLNRTTNSRALMAWIGSIFDPKADTQQYVWVYGRGKNGKSTLGRFLKKCLGRAAAWQQVPHMSDRFWTHGLLGKRLIVFGDCNHPSFVTSGMFKSITGGDGVRIEEKGGAVIDVDLRLKVLFFSNKRPEIADEEADTRRIILCEASPIEGDEMPSYEEQLWLEAPGILAKCFEVYKGISGPRRAIPVENNLQETVFQEVDEKFDYFFHENFEAVQDEKVARFAVREMLRRSFGRDDRIVREFKAYLFRRGFNEVQFFDQNHKRIRAFCNLRLIKSL